MKNKSNSNRRAFIKKVFFGVGLLTIVPAQVVFGRPGRVMPNVKIIVAFCGIGNRRGQILRSFIVTGMVINAAKCDTDMGAEHTQR